MDFGVHLPLMDFGGHPFTLDHLVAYAATGHRLGFTSVIAESGVQRVFIWPVADEINQLERFAPEVRPIVVN